MIEKIRDYIKNNNYSASGLLQFLGKSAFYRACTTNNTSGIIQVKGIRYYYYIIKPWLYCPEGKIDIERL